MSEKRIIKKYPNRRLYDTAISRYITLNDIKQLVVECVDFQVVDAKTEEDLTNSTLLQIILDQEGDAPIFTRDMLEHVIRFYGDSMQSMMSNYLQQSMNFFIEQQAKMRQGFDVFLGNNPLNYMSELAQNNLRWWQSVQENFLQSQKQFLRPDTNNSTPASDSSKENNKDKNGT